MGSDVTESSASPLDSLRHLLLGDDRTEVARLKAQVAELTETVTRLENLIDDTDDRAASVGEVLVSAVDTPTSDQLGQALQPSFEHAVHLSARTDSSVLAAALYPVMGPALRKMIAELFTFGDNKNGGPFSVEQVLLIERESGVLLASSTEEDPDARSDADIVSGMLDAIRLFVQEAFDTTEHDGLRDLRVGDTSVLVEWGPQAVLASVTRGVPTDDYRSAAAQVLEQIHQIHEPSFQSFHGDVEPFQDVVPLLDGIGVQKTSAFKKATANRPALAVAALCLVLLLIVLLVAVL